MRVFLSDDTHSQVIRSISSSVRCHVFTEYSGHSVRQCIVAEIV